ncbi:MAG: PIG-L family deacetylase [Bacteroidales bacterium]|nr:PIG-L family deacetylase [Bacteroidales bacterium]
MKYLIVVAHPDDEALGAGASIWKLTQEGNQVDVCIMCTEAKARAFRPEDNELECDMDEACRMLGVAKKYEGTFPNIEMNNSTHLSLVQFIEKAIAESEPDVIITHHPADTNNDHMHTSMACQAAIRLFQRRIGMKPLREMWFMEVLSSTEWSVNTSMNRFQPNTFIEVGKDGIDIKIKALATYRGVMRPYPHPRSERAIEGLAAYRGAQSGTDYAEAFEVVFRRLTDNV